MSTQDELKKYLGLDSDFTEFYDPFNEGEEVPVEPGPTPDNPWRYTEHSRNVQGSAAAGQDVQGIKGRSMFDGLYTFDQFVRDQPEPDLWQGRLPMITVDVATGDLSGYSDKVNSPYSLYGRQQIASMDDYTGPTTSTRVFDMVGIGEAMGLTSEQVGTLLDPKYETYYSEKLGRDEATGKDRIPLSDRMWVDEDRMTEIINGPVMADPVTRKTEELTGKDSFMDTGRELTGKDLIGVFPREWDERPIIDPTQYEGIGLTPEERNFFIGLGMLSDTPGTRPLELDLDNNKQLFRVARFGANRDSAASLDNEWYSPSKSDPYYFGNVNSFSDYENTFDKWVHRADIDRSNWQAYAQTALALAAIAGLTYGVGTVVAPAAASAVAGTGATGAGAAVASGAITGAVAGGAGSVMTQVATNEGDPNVNWEQVGVAAAGGAVTG